MATLVTEVRGSEAAAGVWAEVQAGDAFRLPLLPWEDVYLHVKRIDNRRLVRAADPAAWRLCWRAIRSAVLALVALVIILLPGVLNRMEAHKVAVLEKTNHGLVQEKAQLALNEAAALSPARLAAWAASLELLDPAPDQVRTLNPAPSQSAGVHARLR